jgi:acyl-CoA thioesterase
LRGVNAGDELARESARAMYDADVASQSLGITIEDVSAGVATARMRVTETMVNGHGIAHGGFIFLLADTAFAFACNTYGRTTVAREGAISFLRPVHAGDELVAAAVERHREGRNGIYDVSVCREGGEVVAEFRGHSRETA